MFTFRHILVPTDFGEASSHALDLGLEIAEKFGSKLTLVHVYEVPVMYSEGIDWPIEPFELEAKRELDAVHAGVKARHAATNAVLGRGPAWEGILEVAREQGVDLIVMGTHGRRGLSRALLGSQTERVVRLSPVPVLTVAEGGERPARLRPSSVPADAAPSLQRAGGRIDRVSDGGSRHESRPALRGAPSPRFRAGFRAG
jgi:nucleotide-binding universal stress UspA family protein